MRTEIHLWSCVPDAPEPVAETPGLQRADAAPRWSRGRWGAGPQVVLNRARSRYGLRRCERREEIGRGQEAAGGGATSAAEERKRPPPSALCGWIRKWKNRQRAEKKSLLIEWIYSTASSISSPTASMSFTSPPAFRSFIAADL